MKNLFLIFTLAVLVSFTSNAQSKDCCSKEKSDGTKVEKCSESNHTMKSGGEVEKSTTKVVKDGKEVVQKEVVIKKVDDKDNLTKTSTCCDGKKVKDMKKEVKEVEKIDTH